MKIAILGACETSLHLAPFNDPSWDIWACSSGTFVVPRVTHRFELHRLDVVRQQYGPGIELLREFPCYMQEAFPEFPLSVAYPKAEMVAKYGRDWFTSSIAYMLALAIERGPTDIGVWGVDMDKGTEYEAQRPACLYFIEKAKARGINVFVPDESLLLKTSKLYAFE